jgi:hypothetical protein
MTRASHWQCVHLRKCFWSHAGNESVRTCKLAAEEVTSRLFLAENDQGYPLAVGASENGCGVAPEVKM